MKKTCLLLLLCLALIPNVSCTSRDKQVCKIDLLNNGKTLTLYEKSNKYYYVKDGDLFLENIDVNIMRSEKQTGVRILGLHEYKTIKGKDLLIIDLQEIDVATGEGTRVVSDGKGGEKFEIVPTYDTCDGYTYLRVFEKDGEKFKLVYDAKPDIERLRPVRIDPNVLHVKNKEIYDVYNLDKSNKTLQIICSKSTTEGIYLFLLEYDEVKEKCIFNLASSIAFPGLIFVVSENCIIASDDYRDNGHLKSGDLNFIRRIKKDGKFVKANPMIDSGIRHFGLNELFGEKPDKSYSYKEKESKLVDINSEEYNHAKGIMDLKPYDWRDTKEYKEVMEYIAKIAKEKGARID